MPSKPPHPHSTRLENLSLDPQGAAFDLEGRPIRLNADGYAAPVASMQELYRHALADYYQRSAELGRQSAAQRPPLLSRLLSWVGRVFERFMPAARTAAAFPPPQPPLLASVPRESPGPAPRHGTEAIHPNRETALAVTAQPTVAGSEGRPSRHLPARGSPSALASSGSGGTRNQGASRREAMPPVLHVVFADQDGVHVIWQLASTKREPNPKGRDSADPKASSPRLELTYGLDSAMAQRLQDCYGQLAQLGYKIAGLDAVRANPEKALPEKGPTKPVPAAPVPAPRPVVAETAVRETARPAELPPSPRKARPKPEASPAPIEPAKAVPESPDRNPSFLPGL